MNLDDYGIYSGRHTGEEIDEAVDKVLSGGCGSCDGETHNNISVDPSNGLIKIVGPDGNTYVLNGVEKLAPPAAAIFGLTGGTYDGSQELEIYVDDAVEVYYTIDGSDPRESETRNSDTYIELPQDDDLYMTTYNVRVVTFVNGLYSEVVQATYNIRRKLPEPIISVLNSDYSSTRTIKIMGVPDGASCVYTINGGVTWGYGTNIVVDKNIDDGNFICYFVKPQWIDSNRTPYPSAIYVNKPSMYCGLVLETPEANGDIYDMAEFVIQTDEFPVTVELADIGYGRVCFAYDKTLGTLKTIKDGNGVDYSLDFERAETDEYYIYTMKASADQSYMTYIFVQ